MPEISKRGMEMPASPIRKLVPLCNDARSRGLKVFALNIGQPDLPSPPEAYEVLHHYTGKYMPYSPSEGTPELRNKLSEYYGRFGVEASADQIIVTTGGSEALLFAFMACLNPGDEIIIPEPAYANYLGFAKMAGVNVIALPSSIESGFALPPISDFKRLITPRTRAILICNPNNPTGYVYTPAELEALAELVKEHDLYLISDEVYREFSYSGRVPMSAYQLKGIENNVIVCDSVSKRYNECGIRIGCLLCRDEKMRSTVLKMCQARLSPPLLGQVIAAASIDATAEYMKQNYDEYLARRNFLVDGLNRIPGVYSPMPDGAFYTVAKLPVPDAEEFCRWCLLNFSYEGATVFMAPAAGFYSTPGAGRDQVRIAYVLERKDLAQALKVLEEALKAYPHTIR